MSPAPRASRLARVLRFDARQAQVELEAPEAGVLSCALRGKLFENLGEVRNPIAVGDRVRLCDAADGPGIEEVLPRRNYLARVASSHDPREQVLFANVDQLFVVSSLRKPDFGFGRVNRILAACRWHRIPAVLLVNKLDLARKGELEELRAIFAPAGVELLATCALDGRGLDELRSRLAGRLSVFYGGSGVGKSSLLNALAPALALKVGGISSYWDKGQHTTSAAQLHQLPPELGGAVIDTPGIRNFRLHGATRQDLRWMFPEFEPFARACHFPDCSHDHEPDCAVYRALEAGKLRPERYATFLELQDELRGAVASEEPDALDAD